MNEVFHSLASGSRGKGGRKVGRIPSNVTCDSHWLCVPLQVKVKGVRSSRSFKPEQRQKETKTDAGLRTHTCLIAEGFWDLCECVLMCLRAGYCALIVEMLLMMAGDVERNPGPSELLPLVHHCEWIRIHVHVLLITRLQSLLPFTTYYTYAHGRPFIERHY